MIDEQDFLHENQVQERDGGFESGATNRLSMLHLSPDAPLHCSTTGIPSKTTSGGGLLEKCTNCGGGSTKRHSPSSFQEPSPKRATLHSASTNHPFPGFTKLPLPNPLPSLIRRTVSEPIYSSDAMKAAQISGFSAGQDSILNPHHEESSKSNAVQETAPPLVEAPPHVPACLYRTMSDPTPAVNYETMTTTTPPRPPAARKYYRSPSRRESPNTKVKFFFTAILFIYFLIPVLIVKLIDFHCQEKTVNGPCLFFRGLTK